MPEHLSILDHQIHAVEIFQVGQRVPVQHQQVRHLTCRYRSARAFDTDGLGSILRIRHCLGLRGHPAKNKEDKDSNTIGLYRDRFIVFKFMSFLIDRFFCTIFILFHRLLHFLPDWMVIGFR